MKRVFVGLSGGVDSSVAAKRLIESGYDVVGVFIKVWQPSFIRCDWEKERLDAMRVAAHLGIPFLTMDAENAYKKEVADYMIDSYKRGLTPNPDVMCNEHVKFGAFFEWAREQGADMIATGHYAQIKIQNGIPALHRAKDLAKDQSYFLARIRNTILPHLLFPIGDTEKSNVRSEAARAKIPTAEKSDSQGICFLGHIDIREFLSHYIELTQGAVITADGTVVGTHEGALLYTLGQRHGFTVSLKGSGARPQYVIARDLAQNTITVSDAPPEEEIGSAITLTDVRPLGSGIQKSMHAVFRYHGPEIPVQVTVNTEGSVTLHTMNTRVETPAQGQICVLYSGTECCGGGIIS